MAIDAMHGFTMGQRVRLAEQEAVNAAAGREGLRIRYCKVVGFTPQRVRVMVILTNGDSMGHTLAPHRILPEDGNS